jgi:hypothetical protein
VDNRTFKRLFFQVLEQDPNPEDMIAFFRSFQAALQARQLTVKGITTDGSTLYPAAIQAVWGDLPHQICEFHTAAVRRQRPESGDFAGSRTGPQAAGGATTKIEAWTPNGQSKEMGAKTPKAARKDL